MPNLKNFSKEIVDSSLITHEDEFKPSASFQIWCLFSAILPYLLYKENNLTFWIMKNWKAKKQCSFQQVAMRYFKQCEIRKQKRAKLLFLFKILLIV